MAELQFYLVQFLDEGLFPKAGTNNRYASPQSIYDFK